MPSGETRKSGGDALPKGRVEFSGRHIQFGDSKLPITGKDRDAGKNWRREETGMTEDEMVGWHHRLNRHEFEQALGVGDRQGNLGHCSPRGRKESDMTERLNWTEATHWRANPASVGKADLEFRERPPDTGIRVIHRERRAEGMGQGGCSSTLVFSFHLKMVSFLCVNAPGLLPKRFKETLNQNLFPPAKKGRFEILLLSKEYIPFCFEKLITCLSTTPLYSLENDVLGVWRLNCFCPADGFVINKESPALFLSQSFFHLV